MSVETEQETYSLEEILAAVKSSNRLILWNDEINTFEHVITCLMKHLQYTEGQAEQIAWKVHTAGKCPVLEGSYTEMEIYRKILKSEGLTVSVE
ncbi:ATP-dependent Clp protease adaptor ClpS [Sphingobacterium sp. SYP-B4668]|uniref:ATP-dependent Clp protease adaptor ClpS n=1 Tax=Sphingobacterium sp. SYP-B4668 TaxID=2996035 RepID=UPI0005326BD6|nr:ATP-dependent Clp protease adaptor ClpS [Sphingobacterium sp. SYP-B4668]